MRALRSSVFSLLDSAKARLELHIEQARKIAKEIANGASRYSDLPLPEWPHKYFGPSEDVDKIRQKIFDERSRLQESSRRLDERYWADIYEIKGKAAEALLEYVDLARRLQAITETPVPTPTLNDLFSFLEAPEPEEVIILHPPSDALIIPPSGVLP